jgi:FemAB-related protein (PEP-CTERM system-associated)
MIRSRFEIRTAAPADFEEIDAFVLAHPRGTIFHRPLWGRAVAHQFGHPQQDLLAFDGETLAGLLPLSLCRGFRGGRALISVPYGVYGGGLEIHTGAARALQDWAQAQAERQGLRRLELRSRQAPEEGVQGTQSAASSIQVSKLYCGFRHRLPEQADQVLGTIPKKARADVRRARDKLGLVLDQGAWYLPDLVRLFQANKHALGSPALPAGWFARLLQDFGPAVKIHVVRRGSLILSAVMSFIYAGELHAYYSGARPGADREYKASSFMYCALQEWAVEQGLQVFDFGRSRKDSGAADFKRRQGFEAYDLPYAYFLVKDRALPSLNPSNPKTAPLRNLWTHLPAGLAVHMGSVASRFLP